MKTDRVPSVTADIAVIALVSLNKLLPLLQFPIRRTRRLEVWQSLLLQLLLTQIAGIQLNYMLVKIVIVPIARRAVPPTAGQFLQAVRPLIPRRLILVLPVLLLPIITGQKFATVRMSVLL